MMASETFMDFDKNNPEDDFNYGVTVAKSPIHIRLGFIRKVYGILSTQLIFTTLVGAFFMYNETTKSYVQQSPNLLFLGLAASFVFVIALHIKRKQAPMNFYLLAGFTIAEAYTVGTVITFYDKLVVLQAFGLTMATVIALTVYTFQSKRDFSSWGAGLFSMLWILIISGFMQMFIQSEIMDTAIAAVGAILFSGFIVFDTHMLIHKLSPEEYILAAINLYLDILNLFLEILKLLGKRE